MTKEEMQLSLEKYISRTKKRFENNNNKMEKENRKDISSIANAILSEMETLDFTKLEFVHQGNFTLAVVSTPSSGGDIYGMSKRMPKDAFNPEMGQLMALRAVVNNVVTM